MTSRRRRRTESHSAVSWKNADVIAAALFEHWPQATRGLIPRKPDLDQFRVCFLVYRILSQCLFFRAIGRPIQNCVLQFLQPQMAQKLSLPQFIILFVSVKHKTRPTWTRTFAHGAGTPIRETRIQTCIQTNVSRWLLAPDISAHKRQPRLGP